MGLAREFALAVKAESPALTGVAAVAFAKPYGYDLCVKTNTKEISIALDYQSWSDLDHAVLKEPKLISDRYAAMAAKELEES